MKDVDIDWCDPVAEDEQEQEEQDNEESEDDKGNIMIYNNNDITKADK